LVLLFSVLLIGIVSAENPCGSTNDYDGEIQQNKIHTLSQTCDDCSQVNLTSMRYPNQSVATMNTPLTKSRQEFTLSFLGTNQLGCYSYGVCGDKEGSYKCENFDFLVQSQSASSDRGVNTTSVFLLFIIIFGFLIWWKVYKLLGALIVFLSGFGVLFTLTEQGWIGWIIIISGFVMLIDALMGSGSGKRYYNR
jgi:hypothetical protein